jgi:hypothetical protein
MFEDVVLRAGIMRAGSFYSSRGVVCIKYLPTVCAVWMRAKRDEWNDVLITLSSSSHVE